MFVAAHSHPARRYQASMPCSSQKRPMSATASSERRQRSTAASAPHSFWSDGNFDHHVIANPPLRPLAPPPQTSPSINTTSVPGERRLSASAVQRPVNPAPTMQTSARVETSRAG